MDGTIGLPTPDAHVIFWSGTKTWGTWGVNWVVTDFAQTWTDASGNYEVEVAGGGSYEVYAYCNYSSSPSFDYVPAHRQISLEETPLNISFTLLPGASIQTVGDLRFSFFFQGNVQIKCVSTHRILCEPSYARITVSRILLYELLYLVD